MYHRFWRKQTRLASTVLIFICLLTLLAACGGNTTQRSSTVPAQKQVLTFPNVGIADLAKLDPASGPDANTGVAVNMIYSGLLKADKSLNTVLPDQATWKISEDNKVYTFTLRPDIKFSDGTPVTAQTYVYSWTRALLPAVNSPIASVLEANIVGANDVSSGKSKVLPGLKALDDHTLQVTMTKPTPYFLEALTNSFFFPINQKVVQQYGEQKWALQVANSGVGTGPFMLKEWDHNVKMVFVPNPYYYGHKTRLTEVDMPIVNNPATAFKAYRAGQTDFVWNLTPEDQVVAKSVNGFLREPQLQSDLLFFDNTKPPFDKVEVRQAFAYALNKPLLTHAVFKDSAVPALTIIPPGMPGHQADSAGLPFNAKKAKSLLQSVYPDTTKVPQIAFSYPNSQVTPDEASALQNMWQTTLGIQVKLNPVELAAYNDETQKHQIQFGFTQWSADFPDPYDWLALNLTSTASNNNGQWKSPEFDQTIAQAEAATGDSRIALYNKAEQIAITNVGWLPLDHQALAAVISPWVHGVSLNGNGLYFGDWSDVYMLQR